MKEYTAYHVVTERPMTVGQVLCLDETYPSGVYRRVMEKVPLVEEIYQNPGAWAGKPLEHHTMVALRELSLEQVRREQFPQHPSRLHCLYVSETREEAQQGPPHVPHRQASSAGQKVCGQRQSVL